MESRREPMSFVARIWLETGLEGRAMWRGHIRHVQSDEDDYFDQLARMKGFLERISGIRWPGQCQTPEEERE